MLPRPFRIPGYLLGMLSLVLAVDLRLRSLKSKLLRSVVWGFLVIITTVGPLLDYSSVAYNDVLNNGSIKLFMEKHTDFIH